MELRRIARLLAGIGVVASAAPAAAQRPAAAQARLAVLEFRAAGGDPCASPDTAETCKTVGAMADAARGGALAALKDGGAGDFTVMTREAMAVVAAEMGAGLCTEGECEVELARNVGADLVVSGDVVILESTHIVTLKLHETAGATLLDTRHVEARGQVEALRAVRQAAADLVADGLGLAPARIGNGVTAQVSRRPGTRRWSKPKPAEPPKPRDPRTGLTLALRGDALVTDTGGATGVGVGWSFRGATLMVGGTYTAAQVGGATARLAVHPFATKRLRPYVAVEGAALFSDDLLLGATGSLGVEWAVTRRLGLTVEAPVTVMVSAPEDHDTFFVFGAVGLVYRP